MRRYTDADAYGLRVKKPNKARAILTELRSRLEACYGERLHGLYLDGSYARGRAEPGGDLDALMVLDHVDSYGREIERTGKVASVLSLDHDVTIRVAYVADQAWRREDTPFLNNVRREARAA